MTDATPPVPVVVDLLPCPFCGCRLEMSDALSNRASAAFIHPSDDPCVLNGTVVWSDKPERIAAWNRRVSASPEAIGQGSSAQEADTHRGAEGAVVVTGVRLEGRQGEPAGTMTVTLEMADGSETAIIRDNGNVISHWACVSSARRTAPPEIDDSWADRFCALVNWSPDGCEGKVVEGQFHVVTFRELAKGYIRAALSAATTVQRGGDFRPCENEPKQSPPTPAEQQDRNNG